MVNIILTKAARQLKLAFRSPRASLSDTPRRARQWFKKSRSACYKIQKNYLQKQIPLIS